MILQLFIFSGSKAAAVNGVTLKSVSIDKKIVSPGEPVDVTVDFTTPDDSRKVFYDVLLDYIDPNGKHWYYSADYKDGIFTSKIDISSYGPKMKYELFEIMVSYGQTVVRFVNKDIDLKSYASKVLTDFSQYGFEVLGTDKVYPVFKGISFSEQEYDSNQWAKIRVEAQWTSPLDSIAYVTLFNKVKNMSSEELTLTKTEEVLKDGVYNAVYQGTYKPYQAIDWTGTWIPKEINVKGTGVSITKYHSTTVSRPFTADLSGNSFTILADKAPVPKLTGASITKGSTNIPLTGKLELYFDKELSSSPMSFDYNIKVLDSAGNNLWKNREQHGKTLGLDLGSQLKANTKYTLSIPANIIQADDGTTVDTEIKDFTFTTGSASSISEGTKMYITQDKVYAENNKINGDLIIAPGINVTIKPDVTFEITGNIIVYGTLVNEGTINAVGNIFVQEQISQAINSTALEKGTLLNKGNLADSNTIVKSYPKPMLYVAPEASGDIDASKVDFILNTYPLLSYSINEKTGVVNKEGLQKETKALNYGSNQLVFKVEDPFGNSEEKTITLNNTSTTIKIIDAFPPHNLSNLPVNTPVYLKLDRAVGAGPGINNVALIDGNGKRVMLTNEIHGEEVVFYPSNSDLAYGTNYTIDIPKDAIMDTKGNYLDWGYSATFSTNDEFTVLGGKDRYDTSLKVSEEGWVKSNYAVLATGNNFPDALSAAPLAAKYSAPILLVKSNELNSETQLELSRLDVKQVFIVGGTGAVSANIEDSLTSKGINVKRLQGNNRYETSVAIARELDVNENTKVFLATGENFPDALSVASIAASLQMPIILTEKTELPTVTKQFFTEKKISDVYIIGGEGVISNSLDGLTATWQRRISGNNRYETNLNVIAEFAEQIDFTYTFFATGQNFPDALSGSALAGLASSPVILVDSNMPKDVIDSFREIKEYIKTKYLLGGESVVPKAVVEKITK